MYMSCEQNAWENCNIKQRSNTGERHYYCY
jgi:hypothetical protein